MEFGYQQKPAIEQLFAKLPTGVKIEFFKDHNGN